MISSIDSIPTPLFQGSLHSRDHKSKTPGPLRSFYVQALASLTPASRRERGKRQGRRGRESRAPWRRPRCQQRRDQAAGLDPASPAPPSPGNRVRDVSRPPDPGGAGARAGGPPVSLALGLLPAGAFRAFVGDSLQSSFWRVRPRPARAAVRISGHLTCLSTVRRRLL